MKKNIIILNLLFVCITTTGQTKISFDRYLVENESTTCQWTINGIAFSPSDEGIIVYPNKEEIDTIIFQYLYNPYEIDTIFSPDEGSTVFSIDTVFCNIPNGQELVIVDNRCCGFWDIITKKDYTIRLEKYNTHYDSIFGIFQNIGAVKFEILNKPTSDTLICSYSSNTPLGQMITINKNYEWLFPCCTAYTGNIISVSIMRKNEKIDYELLEYADDCEKGVDTVVWSVENWDGENWDTYLKQLEILKKFRLRLFNQEKVIIQYDYLSGETKLIVDE